MMKPSLKLGFFKLSFRYKDGKGELAGLAAPLFKKSYYFTFDLFNITLIELPKQEINCASINKCAFLIDYLQFKADYIAGLFRLSEVPDNVTTAPPLNEIDCFILTTPDKKDRTEFHVIVSIFSDTNLWLSLILVPIMIILLVLITQNSSPLQYSSPILDKIWLTIMILLRNHSCFIQINRTNISIQCDYYSWNNLFDFCVSSKTLIKTSMV